jgi:hypothetical protein
MTLALIGAGLATSVSAARTAPPAGSTRAGRIASVAQVLAGRDLSAASASGGGLSASVAGAGWISETDASGDVVDGRADITNVSARMDAGRIRFGLKVPGTMDPRTDVSWQVGDSFAAWLIDANGDDVPDYDAFVFAEPSGFFAGVITDDGSTFKCNANASYVASRHTFSATIPIRCLGNPAAIVFEGGTQYDTDPNSQADEEIQDYAPDATGLPLTPGAAAPTLGGGVATDGFGNLGTFATSGTAPAAVSSGHFGFDIARDVTLGPDGGTGYLLDGFGGLHAVGIDQNHDAATAAGAYWPGWDIARGVTIARTGSAGFTLDAYGGLHSFGIGQDHSMPTVVGGPYWPGWDISRGVALTPDGRGGFILDGFGGLHWFSLGSAKTPPPIVGAPYWQGWDVARGIAISPDGASGYVVDATGVLHPFGIGGATALPGRSVGPLAARGVGLFPKVLALPKDAPAP